MNHQKKQYFHTLLEGFHEIMFFFGFLKVFLFLFTNKTKQLKVFCFVWVKNTKHFVFLFFLWKNKNCIFWKTTKNKNTSENQNKTIISWNPSSSVRKSCCFFVFHVFLHVLLVFYCFFLVLRRVFKVLAETHWNT